MAQIRTRILRPVMALALAVGLSACASVDTTSRDAPFSTPLSAGTDGPAAAPEQLSNIKVVNISVNVPQSLKVSEANRYYPSGDIVWREDPLGDRHAQVAAIVKAGLTKGTGQMQGDREVVLKVMVTRFHALSEKARYTIGGVHAIQFYMEVVDANTGEVLLPSTFVKADFDAVGGQAAVAEEARGYTQKVRITDHLAMVIQQQLGASVSYVYEASPVMGAINQL